MGKQIRYTPEYKVKTVEMYIQGDLSANQLALSLGIHPHTVRHWIQDYNDGKLTAAMFQDNEKGGDFSNRMVLKQQEPSKRLDVEIILAKISALESETMELKSILQTYLLKW